ncbi:MAG: hypothetical protein KDD94_11640, partial [Calditrichaeota bacterium]|nr:hypothetical protein [Calditrichota bacterium]
MTDEIIALLNRPQKDNVVHLDNGQSPYFSDLYHQLREAEGRIYSDDILLNLPDITKSHKLYSEWQQRETSLNLLKTYLEDYPYNSLLDFGCGNG